MNQIIPVAVLLAFGIPMAIAPPSVVMPDRTLSSVEDAFDLNTALKSFKEYRDSRATRGMEARFLPELKYHRWKTQNVVVFFHSAGHSTAVSQDDYRRFAETFNSKGYTVLSIPLLRRSGGSDVSYQEWQHERERAISVAKHFGRKVLIAGHGEGALLALDGALLHPEAGGVFLWDPTLRLTSSAGHQAEGLLSEMIQRHSAERVLASQAADDLQRRAQVYRKLSIPVFVSYGVNEPRSSASENERFLQAVKGRKKLIQTASFQEMVTAMNGFVDSSPARLSGRE